MVIHGSSRSRESGSSLASAIRRDCVQTYVASVGRSGSGFRFSDSPSALSCLVSARHISCICVGRKQMFDHDIRIRIAGEGFAFVYSIWRAGELITTAEIPALGEL